MPLLSDHSSADIVDLNDLPRWSPWPARLLGLEPWKTVQRTTGKVEQEYGKEKYGACQEYLANHPSASPEELKQFELGDTGKELCISHGEQLYRSTVGVAWKQYCDGILAFIEPLMDSADIVCDLGCGYGYHLWLLQQRHPEKTYWGGEFTASGVGIAGQLFKGKGPRVEQLDLTDTNYSLPFSKNDRVLVLSVFGFHQLPSCKKAVERLAAIKGPEWNICHVEPVLDWCSGSLLGNMRKAYTTRNDYNRDLLPSLETSGAKIVRSEKEWFGMNPLHPASLVHWR